MKKICLFALLAFVGMAACTDDQVTGGDGPDSVDGKYKVNVTLRLPGTDVVSYADPVYKIASAPEVKVDTIEVYMFYQKVTGTGDFVLQQVFKQNYDFEPAHQGTAQSITLQVEGEGEKHFYFVANDTIGMAALANVDLDVTKEDDFRKLLTDKTPLGTPLLMTAYAEADPSSATGGSLTISNLTLDRVGARIDIENWEQTLSIDSVQLLKTPDQSYIVADTSSATGSMVWKFADATRIDREVYKVPDDARYAPRTAGTAYENNDSIYLPSLYYPYETNCINNNHSIMKIWGRLNAGKSLSAGARVVYEIPLQQTTANSADPTASRILRNHRYVVRISNALSGAVDYTFKLKEWQYSEGDTIKRPITAGNINLDWGDVAGNGWDNTSKTLQVDSLFPAGQADTTYIVKVSAETEWKAKFVEASLTAGADQWITINNPTDGQLGTEFSLVIKPNTFSAPDTKAEPREAMIRVESDADAGRFYTFTIKQRGNAPAPSN